MMQHPILVPQRVQLGINPFTPNGISNSYHSDLSIFVLSINIFYSNFNRNDDSVFQVLHFYGGKAAKLKVITKK